MKVLITGGAGFIGSHLTDSLLLRGDQVLVIDNYATGRRDNLTSQPRLEIVEGTIADLFWLTEYSTTSARRWWCMLRHHIRTPIIGRRIPVQMYWAHLLSFKPQSACMFGV